MEKIQVIPARQRFIPIPKPPAELEAPRKILKGIHPPLCPRTGDREWLPTLMPIPFPAQIPRPCKVP